jgi:chorismate mutase-like protein
MRIFPIMTAIVLMAGNAFSQSFQWDQSTALKKPGDQLVNSISARLLLSREVAWSKFCSHAKVRDLAREAKVLTDLKEAGRKIGLTPDQVTYFFKPQIIASCRLQEELIGGWATGAIPRPTTPPKDLAGEIRPLLDKIDQTLLLQWKAVCSKPFDPADYYAAKSAIQEQGFSSEVAGIAARPMGGSFR